VTGDAASAVPGIMTAPMTARHTSAIRLVIVRPNAM
jgi:hypothetical protein